MAMSMTTDGNVAVVMKIATCGLMRDCQNEGKEDKGSDLDAGDPTRKIFHSKSARQIAGENWSTPTSTLSLDISPDPLFTCSSRGGGSMLRAACDACWAARKLATRRQIHFLTPGKNNL